MYAKIITVILSFVLCGCNSQYTPQQEVKSAPWQTAPQDYVCTSEEMQRVQLESAWCDKNTSFFSSYCYGTAFIRNCKLRGK